MRRLLASALLLALTLPAIAAPPRPAPRKIEIAPGVFVFMTVPYGAAVGLDGNSIVVLSNDGVLVFDSNGTPAAAAAVLAEIRAMTDQPVRYVVHSHWHWDHWYGAEVYKRAFPTAKIVAHEKTRALMAGPALAFNKPGLDTQLPEYIRSLVTGHGEPLRDRTLLRATMDVFRVLLKEGEAARARGLDPDQARDAIKPTLQPLMLQIAGDAPARQAAFRTQLVDWYLHRVYDELAGPLTDEIASIPPQ